MALHPLPLTAAVTAGGQSSRFGRDKALAEWGGQPLLWYVAQSLAGAKQHLLIAPPGKYHLPGWRAIPDRRPGEGPLAGLEAALSEAQYEWVAFVGVDLPALTPDYWQRLWSARHGGARSVQAHSGEHPQPLAALYHVTLLPRVSALLDAGERRLRQAVRTEETAFVTGLDPRWLRNVNRPADLEALAAEP